MSEAWLIISEAAKEKLRIGDVVDTREYFVDDRLVKKYQLALRDPNPLYWNDEYAEKSGRWGERVCPSGMALALNPMERSGCCPASAFWADVRGVPDTGRHWGGFAAYNRFELERPIRLGDTVRCDIMNRDCYEKQGKRAILVCAESEYRMFNQDGEKIGVGIYGNMRDFPYPEGTQGNDNG